MMQSIVQQGSYQRQAMCYKKWSGEIEGHTSEDHHDIIVLFQDSFAAVCEQESEREDRHELPHLIKHLRVEKKADRTERESYG